MQRKFWARERRDLCLLLGRAERSPPWRSAVALVSGVVLAAYLLLNTSVAWLVGHRQRARACNLPFLLDIGSLVSALLRLVDLGDHPLIQLVRKPGAVLRAADSHSPGGASGSQSSKQPLSDI